MAVQYFPLTATQADIDLRLLAPFKGMLANSRYGVDVEIKEHKHRRTNEQNRYYWANLSDVAQTLNEAGLTYGEYALPYTAELVHEINKRIFGETTTAKMSVGEFCDYMTKVLAFWIERTYGFFTPKETPEKYLIKTGLIRGIKK